MKKQMSRRDFLRITSLTAAGAVLAACQPQVIEKTVEVEKVVKETVEVEKAVEVEVTSEPAPVRIAEIQLAECPDIGPPGMAFWEEDIVGRFNAENADIHVKFVEGGTREWKDKVFAQAVAGVASDVIMLWGGRLVDFYQAGLCLELDDYFDVDARLEEYYPAQRVQSVVDGHLLGLPRDTVTNVMAYNKDLLDEAGVEYPTADWDWNDWLAAMKATTKRDEGQWGTFYKYGADWVFANGGEVMNKEFLGDKCLLDQPRALEAFEFFHDMLWGPDPVIAKSADLEGWSTSTVLGSGKCTFARTQSWMISQYIRDFEVRWGLVEMPKGLHGDQSACSIADGYFVYAQTKEPDASARLIDWLTSPWASKAMCLGALGLQPARRDQAEVWDTLSIGAKAGYDVGSFSRTLEYARLDPFWKDNAKTNELMGPFFDKIWVTGELGVQEGYEQMAEAVNEYYGTS